MNPGDLVVLTANGQVQVEPKGSTADDAEKTEAGDAIIGEIVEVREQPDDHVVALRFHDTNVAPPFATISTVREQYGR